MSCFGYDVFFMAFSLRRPFAARNDASRAAPGQQALVVRRFLGLSAADRRAIQTFDADRTRLSEVATPVDVRGELVTGSAMTTAFDGPIEAGH
jgi:hypothetical protein